ncbi:MAG TPA: glycosyltransferase, partial [Spirochaetales bacterium]|nr:glycosyltransferase [Spirochaetales bacterium]
SADVRAHYARLDLLMLTSVREAQPLVILEAYAAGVPVVSTAVGNVAELLDYDERFLASPRDPSGLAKGALYVHSHPEKMQSLREANKRRVESFYDKRILHGRYRKLYTSLAEGTWQA